MRKKIAVIMGGYSSEYQISLKSGNTVCRELDNNRYEVYPIHILKDKWVYPDSNGYEYPIDKSDFSLNIKGDKIYFDSVFNAIHGHPGEDGLILAYLEILGIPHTSDPSYLMALTFNKKDCISVLDNYHIPHAISFRYRKGDTPDIKEISRQIGFPCFVKANRSGSSFGISKVNRSEDLPTAIEKAFEEDDEVIIEEFLDGTEVSVGVVTYQGEIMVLPITEIISETGFFDYEAKYLGKSQEITPARLPDDIAEKVRQTAEKVYRSLGMKGLSRAEYIIRDGEPYFLEINTVPGLTSESILPQQARHAGLKLGDLFSDLIENSLPTD